MVVCQATRCTFKHQRRRRSRQLAKHKSLLPEAEDGSHVLHSSIRSQHLCQHNRQSRLISSGVH